MAEYDAELVTTAALDFNDLFCNISDGDIPDTTACDLIEDTFAVSPEEVYNQCKTSFMYVKSYIPIY